MKRCQMNELICIFDLPRRDESLWILLENKGQKSPLSVPTTARCCVCIRGACRGPMYQELVAKSCTREEERGDWGKEMTMGF